MMSLADHRASSNPFPGLRPFATSEADLFFGREQQIAELVARLDEVSFVAVAGSSGCGKSSLVRAGLLSALARHSDAGSDAVWRAVVMRPGNSPITNLAEQLAPLLSRGTGSEESRTGTLYGRLRLGGLGLVEAVNLARIDPHTRVLVVVDQFEEIFRFQRMTDPDEASAFVKLLLHAANDPRSPVRVVITVRSDALGFCADFRGLPEAVSRGQYLVPKLTREQRKEAIVKPVELRGSTIAPRLVQRLLNDVSDNFDDLPVMQHVLTRTWNHWAHACDGQRPIDLDDYNAVGTTSHALSNHADEAFNSLPGLEPVVEKVFRALTERITEGTEVRRPLAFDNLCQVVGEDKRGIEQVVERYRRPDTAFLMPPPEALLSSSPVIDISHESLIRQWDRLRQWTQAEADSRAMLLRLVEAARRNAAKLGSLWRGPELKKGLEWRQSTAPTPAWVGLYAGGDGADIWQSATIFLDDSARAARREQRQWRLMIALACSLVVGILGIGAFAARDALKRQKLTMSRELTNRALLEVDPARSAHFALAAIDEDPNNVRAEYAVRQALATLEVAHTEKILPHNEPVVDVRYTRDGSRLVTASGKQVNIFDTRTFELVGKPIARAETVENAWLVANNTTLITRSTDDSGNRRAQIQRIGDSTIQQISCEGQENSGYPVTVSPDERLVALGCSDGRIRVWEVAHPGGPEMEFGYKGGTLVTALAFSSNGEYLASGDYAGVVTVWKPGQSDAWIGKAVKDSPIRHTSAVRDIGFYPDNPDLLVTAGDDGQALVWKLDLKGRRLAPGEKNRWPLKHDRPVILSRFVPRADDTSQLFTVSDKTARLWNNEERNERQARGHDDWVNDANSSADGELLVTASSDGTARVWSTRSGSPVAVLRGHRDDVTRAVIGADGNQVATASSDGTVRVWRIHRPELLVSDTRWMLSAAFAPNGKRIAVGGEGPSSILERSDIAGSPPPDRQNLPQTPSTGTNSFMSWSRDGKFLVGRGMNNGLSPVPRSSLWDVNSRQQITPEWLKMCRSASFSAGRDELITVDEKGRIAIWDATDLGNAAKRSPKIPAFGEGYWTAVISPDGGWIAAIDAITGNKNITLWKREESRIGTPRVLTGHNGGIRSLQFSGDSKWLVTASSDRTARIWPVDSAGAPKVLSGDTAMTWAAFNPSANRVVTASADSTIRVWDAETANELAVLRWHGEEVNEVQFSPDSKWILSASDDGTVKLGQCEACNMTVNELRERVREIATLPDEELNEIRREIDARSPYFRLPSFSSRDR
jgi:WD40 repeat protein